MSEIRTPNVELTDKCEEELDDFIRGANDHVNVHASYDVEGDSVTVTFTCPYELKQEMDDRQIGTTFEEFVLTNEHVVDNVFETGELVEETEFKTATENIAKFSFRVNC